MHPCEIWKCCGTNGEAFAVVAVADILALSPHACLSYGAAHEQRLLELHLDHQQHLNTLEGLKMELRQTHQGAGRLNTAMIYIITDITTTMGTLGSVVVCPTDWPVHTKAYDAPCVCMAHAI